MSTVEYEAYNVIVPLQNTPGMKDMCAVLITQTSAAINLSDYFGSLGDGHYFTAQADGAPVYIAGAYAAGTGINEQTAGNGSQVCWKIPDGQQQPFRLIGGKEGRATGWGGTGFNCASGFVLHAKLAISGVATGWLRIQRSSVAPGQGIEQFRAPGFPVVSF